MAKQSQSQSVALDSSASSLAERLFIANWNPSSGYTAESVAEKCIDAEEVFRRVQRRLAELRINEAA